MYSCAVTADSGKKELQRRVSSKVRHWCSKFILCCHSRKRPRQWNPALVQWDSIMSGLNTPPLPQGVKVVLSGAGSQFTQGKQARQPNDKLFTLNKAFRNKGRATSGYLSCLWRPLLPLACLLPLRHLTIHHVWQVSATARDGSVKCKVGRGKTGTDYTETVREGKLSLDHNDVWRHS